MTTSPADANAPSGEDDSLAAVLAMSRPSFSAELVAGQAAAALTAACRRLPADLTTFWGVESRLGDTSAEVDLLVEIKRNAPGHQLLDGTRASAVDALCARSPDWNALRRMALAWANRGHPLHQLVRNIWLEFDLVAAHALPQADALERPSVFWGPEPAAPRGTSALADLLDEVGAGFDPFPRRIPHEAVEAAVRQLPPAAQVFQAGAMRSRGDVVLRLCVNRMAAADVPGWLASLGWHGDTDALREALRPLEALVRMVAVDVDFTQAGIGLKVGIECYLDWKTLSSAQWHPLLDHVGGLGLCCEAKRRAIAGFPGRTDLPLRAQHGAGPAGLLHPVVFRNIHHVKLAFAGRSFVEAKAYLGVSRPAVHVREFVDHVQSPAADEHGWVPA